MQRHASPPLSGPDPEYPLDQAPIDNAMREIQRLREALWYASTARSRRPSPNELAELHQLRELLRTVHENASLPPGDLDQASWKLSIIAQITKRPVTQR